MTPTTYMKRRQNKAEAMELILFALRCGVMAFDNKTAELRFNGMRYSTVGAQPWTFIVNHCGRDNIIEAIEKSIRA